MKYLEEGVWFYVLIILDDGIIEFYLDGKVMFRGIKSLKGEVIIDGELFVLWLVYWIGKSFNFLIKKFEFFERKS